MAQGNRGTKFPEAVGTNNTGAVNVMNTEKDISLIKAAKTGDAEAIRTLIDAGADVNARNNKGSTAITNAAKSGDADAVRTLVSAGANVNATNNDGYTALMIASMSVNVEVVRTLIGVGANVNATKNDGNTALNIASIFGNTESVRTLIDAGANVNATHNDGSTALMNASFFRNTESVRTLIDAGANVNATNNDGSTALMNAAESGDAESVRTLIGAGANVNATNNEGDTVLMNAAMYNNDEYLFSFNDADADVNATDIMGSTTLLDAALSNNEEALRTLIDADADVNATDIMGSTGFMDANMSNNAEALRTLIDAGANVNATNNNGCTALTNAALFNNAEAVRTLIDAGANVNATDNCGNTALTNAAKSGNAQSVRTLMDAGVDVNAINIMESTLIVNPAKSGIAEAVRTLIDGGADVNTTNSVGSTLLMDAAMFNNVEALRTLIDAGVDVNATKNEENTALMNAVMSGYPEAVRTLIDAGANVNASNYEGCTALMYAAESFNKDALRALIDAGADVNAVDKHSRTALFYTANLTGMFFKDAASIENTRILLDTDINVNVKDILGKTALFYHVEKGIIQTCSLLIEGRKALVNVTDKGGQTPLFFALHSHNRYFSMSGNRFDTAQLLLSNGAIVKETRSLLIFWIEFYLQQQLQNNLYSMFDFVIGNGFERETVVNSILDVFVCRPMLTLMTETNSVWSDPFVLQEFGGNLSIPIDQHTWTYLLTTAKEYTSNAQRKADIENIIEAIEMPNCQSPIQLFHLIIELGVNLNTVDSEGNTVLHYATILSFSGAPQEVVMLILKHLNENGIKFNIRNARRENAILYCLTWVTRMMLRMNCAWSEKKTLFEVCQFLVENGSDCDETNRDGQTVFHFLMKLFQNGFQHDDLETRSLVLEEALKLLGLFSPPNITKGITVNKPDDHLDSPLHLWARLCLPSARQYTGKVTKNCTFQDILDTILKHLLGCGILVNTINCSEETPFHLCRTWTAAKLLIEAGANWNLLDALKRPPLLFAAHARLFEGNLGRFYPDVTEEPFTFFKACNESGLELWAKDSNSKSIFSILLESEEFSLTEGLVQVACGDPRTNLQDLLETVCRDVSPHSYWKTTIIEKILKSNPQIDLSMALFCCCDNIRMLMDGIGSSDIDSKSDDDDHGEPPMKKSKYEASTEQNDDERNEYGDDDDSKSKEAMSSVHWLIARKLRSYGADGDLCKYIARDIPELQELLKAKIDITQIPSIIPWTSHSKVHKPKLDLVARRQNFKVVNNYWYHEEPIGKGAFGHVFAGINGNDGREVAIKRVEKLTMVQYQNRREIENLIELSDCKHVVQYIEVDDQKEGFAYIFLELMEGTLDDFFKSADFDGSKRITFCKHVLLGLEYLHKQRILHRDLKPQNILYKTYPEVIIKIADFGLSRQIDVYASFSVMGTNVGTRGWIAPEVVKSVDHEHTELSDIFASGLVLHYIMALQKHPFSPKDCAVKNPLLVSTETEFILKYQMTGWDNSLSSEVTHLVMRLLEDVPEDRLTAAQALDHPMFWSKKEKIDFLLAAGEELRSNDNRTIRRAKEKLENQFEVIVEHGAWNADCYTHMDEILRAAMPYCDYDVGSVEDLLRLLKNAKSHFRDQKSNPIGKWLLEDYIYLDYFPNLVIEVYKIVETYHWNETKSRIKHALRD